MLGFPKIASSAKRLRIFFTIQTSVEDRNDVVKLQMFTRSAIGAVFALPFTSLSRCELKSMTAFRWLFLVSMVLSSWKRVQHFISISKPQFLGSFRNSLASFICVLIAQTVLVANGLSFPRLGDEGFSFRCVASFPERITAAGKPDALAFLRASAGSGCGNLGWRSIEFFSANYTNKPLACLGINTGHRDSKENVVNSEKHLDSTPEYKSTLSQAQGETIAKVQRLEGEANAIRYAGNPSTSAAAARHDIVRAAWRHAEVEVKFLYDNKTDDQLDVTPMDGLTKAFFNWAQAASPISISRIEERKNSGEYAMLNLLKTKTEQATLGIKEGFAKAVLQGNGPNTATAITTAFTSPQNGAPFVEPLPLMVKFDPTSSTSIGNINQLTYSWWRNQFLNSGGTTFAGILKELDHLFNNCTKGPGGAPNFHLLDQSTFELYQAALWAKVQNPSYAKTDYPFETLLFHGQNVFWSQYIPDVANGTTTQTTTSGTWWMLNTQFLKIKYDKETNFLNTPFIRPENADAKTAQLLWYGAHVCSNRRKQGVAGSIDTTVTS